MKCAVLILLVWLSVVSGSRGHSMMTAYLDMVEAADGNTTVSWRRPIFPGGLVTLQPSYPTSVKRVTGEPLHDEGTFIRERYILRGAPGLWSDTSIGLTGEGPASLEVLVRLQLANGMKHVAVLRNASDIFTVPAQPDRWQAARSYLWLGFNHILMGVDHLLFVFGLLFLVPNALTLVKTITSFTVAHSITLGIATLGLASVPMPPLNLAIALSIFFLGPEMVRKARGQTSLTIRRPWLVAFAFGLLHGFGFASGLTTLGLPREDIPVALLLFNIGVEIGQVIFVFLVLMLGGSFRRLQIDWPRWVEKMPSYAVGGLGAFWAFQRAFLFLDELR